MKKLLFVFAAVTLVACGKDDDEAPEVTDNVKPVIAEFGADHTTVTAGGEIHLDIKFTDNEALNQAKIEIHENFDGHSHKRVAAPFEWEKILDLAGQKSYTDHMDIDVPADASSGSYHVTCLVTDKSGNESELMDFDLEIENPGQPVIDLTSPDPNASLSISPSAEIMLEGTVKDDNDLTEVHIRIFPEGHEDEVIYEAEIEMTGGADVLYDLADINTSNLIKLPATLDDPAYELEIKAVDNDENHSVLHVELEVQ